MDKNVGEDRFWNSKIGNFWEIEIKVRTGTVILRFQNAITLAKNNMFWSGKKPLVAGVPLY